MAQVFYTYQMRITQNRIVHTEQRDPNHKTIGQPSGGFRYYEEPRRMRIQESQQKAMSGTITSEEGRQLGIDLAEALFDNVLLRDFFNCYEQARREGAWLRLELDVDERLLPEVAALPWEWMYVPASADHGVIWFATDPHLALVRRREQWHLPVFTLVAPGESLVLARATSAPATLGPVRYERIWEKIQELCASQPGRFALLEPVKQASIDQIDALLECKPHLLHLIGHGRFHDEDRREVGQFALVDDPDYPSDEPLWVGAEQLGELFRRHAPAVAVLQACEGAVLSSSQAFLGMASHIVQQSVPLVVAMQYELSNATAQRFLVEFYKRIAHGVPVEKAVQEGRRMIALGPQDYTTRDFATPVIFMSAQDGHLFASPEAERVASPIRPPRPSGAEIYSAKEGGVVIGRQYGGSVQVNNTFPKRIPRRDDVE